MYRCGKCNEPVGDINTLGIQCKKCGSKIFYKKRPDGAKKVLKSD